jgi:hypothetical protein
MQMLLVHDIGEIDTGDTIVYDDTGLAERKAAERVAVERIFGMLPNAHGARFLALWEEFEGRCIARSALRALRPIARCRCCSTSQWRRELGRERDRLRARDPQGRSADRSGLPGAVGVARAATGRRARAAGSSAADQSARDRIDSNAASSTGKVPNARPCAAPGGFRRTAARWRIGAQHDRACNASAMRSTSRRAAASSGVAQHRAKARDRRIERGMQALAEFGEEGLAGVGLAMQRAQDVEALDVAAAFPDRIERRLAIQARQQRFLDVTVAAEAFLRFVDEGRRTLADPVFADRRRDARERGSRGSRSDASTARATRIDDASAASDSIAKSASTLRISGWSASNFPNAMRCRA